MAHLAYPVTAIREDGFTMVAATPEEAAAFHNLDVGPKHVEVVFNDWDYSKHITRSTWVLRDAYGDPVDPYDLPQPPRRRSWWASRAEGARQAAERGLPIPGTSNRYSKRWAWRSFDMNIKARAEEAALASDMEEWGVAEYNVGRKHNHKLPKIYDDVGHRHYDRNWKRSRRTRWKAGAT